MTEIDEVELRRALEAELKQVLMERFAGERNTPLLRYAVKAFITLWLCERFPELKSADIESRLEVVTDESDPTHIWINEKRERP